MQTEQKRARNNGKVKAKPGDKKIIDIPEQSRHIEDQDTEFFDAEDVGDYSFLKRLDEKELGKRVEKEKIQHDEMPEKAKFIATPVSDEELSDEEGLGDALSDALEEENINERDWDEEQEYEQKPRKGDSLWRKKESTRLPVRTTGGGLKELEASASESESSDESEASDSDSDLDASEQAIQPEEIPKTEREAVIEAKEALARLADEIAEAPEEKVLFRHCWLTKISNLKAFREIYNKGNPTIKKLALITQLTVYKDIIPGYRLPHCL